MALTWTRCQPLRTSRTRYAPPVSGGAHWLPGERIAHAARDRPAGLGRERRGDHEQRTGETQRRAHGSLTAQRSEVPPLIISATSRLPSGERAGCRKNSRSLVSGVATSVSRSRRYSTPPPSRCTDPITVSVVKETLPPTTATSRRPATWTSRTIVVPKSWTMLIVSVESASRYTRPSPLVV